LSERPTPWWGTGAAATQCEGAAPRSDWAGWEAEGRVPPSGAGNGFRTRYADDFALLAEHGITHHRLTVEWARLEPREGRWDEDEVAHLRRVLEAGRDVGVAVWACLLHGSAPGWFTDDRRGWLDDKAATLTWPRHVDRVAEALGDLVAGWVPIHEPDLAARLGYGEGVFPPGRRREDDARDALATLRTAEAEAARLLRTGGTPVAVTARPGEPREAEDLLIVGAAADELDTPLEQAADAFPDAGIVVVTGDPTGEGRVQRAADTVPAAHRDGMRVVGAFHLPAIDGYEWHRGFDARLGLFDRDRNPKETLGVLVPTAL
jgi:beta-glucosidase/6-phospho-beta-glucosidase/beta-galactosidase